MTTLGPVVLRYIADRQRAGEIAGVTARNQRAHLWSFVESFGNRPLGQLSRVAVVRWLEEMSDRGLAPATKALRLSTLRNFARWCVIHHVVDRDWTLDAPRVRRPRQQPRDMTNQHVAKIMAQARDARTWLICWLLFGCGLRCVEAHRLNVDDLDRLSGLLFITGKAGHEREVWVPPVVVAAWDEYLAGAGHTTGALIRHMESPRRLSATQISRIVHRLSKDAGVKVRPYDGRSAHGLRAAGASDLYDVTKDPVLIQSFLGHASLTPTRRYLRRATLGDLQAGQSQRPWGEVTGLGEPTAA